MPFSNDLEKKCWVIAKNKSLFSIMSAYWKIMAISVGRQFIIQTQFSWYFPECNPKNFFSNLNIIFIHFRAKKIMKKTKDTLGGKISRLGKVLYVKCFLHGCYIIRQLCTNHLFCWLVPPWKQFLHFHLGPTLWF
jgi:hypothetical protein